MLRGNWGQVEADFQREYGLDLAACVWGPNRIGVRRLDVLVRELPTTARLYQTAQGGSWGVTEELLAQCVELLYLQVSAFMAANSRKPKRVKPQQIPRPTYKLTTGPQEAAAGRSGPRRGYTPVATFEQVAATLAGVGIT